MTIEKVREFILEHGVEELTNQFGIKVKDYDNHIVLNYDQIESPKNHPIADACRALILYKDANYSVATRSFGRFFNLGECNQSIDNWSDYTINEKADGSHISLRHDLITDRWEISTRGTAFAESMMGNMLKTFRQGVIEAFGFSTEEEFQDFAHTLMFRNYVYTFEFTSPENRIVTRYVKPEMVLLSVFDIYTGVELTEEQVNEELLGLLINKNIRGVNKWHVDSQEALDVVSDSLGDLDEGFVCYNPKTGHRVKIKRSMYLKVHRLAGNGSPSVSDVIDLILDNEHDEFLCYFNEYRPMFDQALETIHVMKISAEKVFSLANEIADQKGFALAVKDHPLSSILFTARAKKISVSQAFDDAKRSFLIKVISENMREAKS